MSSADDFRRMDREWLLAGVLREHGIELFFGQGLTDLAGRRERARAAIIELGLEQCALDFESIYGQSVKLFTNILSGEMACST